MNWDDLRLLLAVARHGSFLRAGEAMDIAPSTLSRRMTRLEKNAGALLLERAVDGARLTARGRILVDMARQMESELVRGTSTEISGTLTVSAGEGFITPVNAAIARFTTQFPQCAVDFSITSDMVKIARGATDVAIRTLNTAEPSLIYQRLPGVQFGVFAAPDYVALSDEHLKPEDVRMIDLLPPLDQLAHLKAARAAGFSRSGFRVSSFTAQLDAVKQGYGAAVLPRLLAAGLIELYLPIELPMLDVFLVSRPDALRQPHIRSFVDILKAEVSNALTGLPMP